MKKINLVLLILSILLLLNIVLQIIYFPLVKEGKGGSLITGIVSFMSNFNLLTVMLFPIILFLYSLIIVFMKEKNSLLLLIINLFSCSLFFFT